MTARKTHRTTGNASKNKKALTSAHLANQKLDAELKASKPARDAAKAEAAARAEAEAQGIPTQEAAQ